MFDKKQNTTDANKKENTGCSSYPKDSKSSNASKGCGCKKTAPADEEVIEIEEERWDY